MQAYSISSPLHSGSWVTASSWRRLHTSPRTRRGTGGGASGY
jgi:hypothetical protein